MYIPQISTFIENSTGRLEEFTKLLSENGIDLQAITVADTTDFGMVRVVVDQPDFAIKTLRDAGYTTAVTDVLAVAVEDSPGGLTEALAVLRGKAISVEYLYSLVRRIGESAVIILRVSDPENAVYALQDAGITLIGSRKLSKNPQQ